MTYSELRASDAERERVVTFLREHALLGRLNDDELEDRIGLAYAAVTVGDLERLIADLPRAGQPAPRPRPQRAPVRARRTTPQPALIGLGLAALFFTGLPLAIIGVAVALLAVLVIAVFALGFALGPFILIGLLIAAVARRRRPARPMRFRAQY
jgi:hypothetical protein